MSLYQIEEIFGPQGLLQKELAPHYEWRPQQREMARAVHQTLQDGGRLLVEAPTGVGKSLGYLVPGILWAMENRRPLVVSTYTRGLQDQILNNDLPHLRRLIPGEIRCAVLKGRSNYLCRNRWHHYLAEVQGTVEGEELVRALGAWVQTTESGDLGEAPLPKGSDAARILAAFPRISGEARFCSSGLCSPESGCFFKTSRARAREATLVIVNHALLLIDLFSDAAGLPEWSAVVIDEGHHLPRVAADPLSFSASESGLEAALKGLGGRGEPGSTDSLRMVLRGHPGKVQRSEELTRLRELDEGTARLLLQLKAFWGELKAQPAFPAPDKRLRYGPAGPIIDLFPAIGFDLCSQLGIHLDRIREAGERVRVLRKGAAENELLPLLEAEQQAEEARSALQALEELLTPTREGFIYWIEPAGSAGAALRAAPLEVGPQLWQSLFSRKEAVVLTSATLAVMDRFDHLAQKLGLGEDLYEGLCLSSPFRLQEQVGAFVLTSGPDPNHPAFPEAMAAGIELLARTLRRKMLVLFTSHDSLRRVEALLRRPLSDRGIRLLAQGVDGGQRAVQRGFKKEGPAVLLGAASFWEGVDFPGEELEVLLMARLPFLVPTDPMVEAMSEKLEREGIEPFRGFHLPEAVIRFRQGFGRLIRRLGDRGLFVVVDPRLENKPYGSQFKKSVGVPFRAVADWDDLAAAGESWFASTKEPEA